MDGEREVWFVNRIFQFDASSCRPRFRREGSVLNSRAYGAWR